MCRHETSRIINSRPDEHGHKDRRRECLQCGARWNTIELTAEQWAESKRVARVAARVLHKEHPALAGELVANAR